jgi:hypothetical protein
MQCIKLLLTIFSIYFCNISAMELIVIPADLFITKICSQINRPTRDALRRTCKKYYECVISQDTLNGNYAKFLVLKDNAQILHWKNLGALFSHQELARAVKDKKFELATWLLAKNKVSIWNAYCRNIKDAVEEKKVEEIVPLIAWLLDTRKPQTHLNEFLSGYHFANNLKEKYLDVQKIIDVFKEYEKKRLTQELADDWAKELILGRLKKIYI